MTGDFLDDVLTAPLDDGDSTPHVGDYLAVDIGPMGLRARRTGSAEHEEMRLDIPQLLGVPSAHDLMEGVSGLLEPHPPTLVVWTLGGAAAAVRASDVLSASAARGVRSIVVDSATATLVGALGGVEPGVVLEMTSGVRTIVTDFDRLWRRIDGFGPVLGDRGSGAWLGAQGLAAGLRFRDGVPGGSEALLKAGRHAFGDEDGWRTMLETLPMADVLADFAPVVGEVARTDTVAEGLCRLAGEHLADAICAGAELLPPKSPITATGGLLLVEAVKRSFAHALGKRYKILVPALGDTLAGTRTLAEHVLSGGHLPHHPPHIHIHGQYELIR